MYIIKKGDYFVKVVNSVPTLVTSLDKATTFNSGEAEKYIKNQVKKSDRVLYDIELVDSPVKQSKNQKLVPEFTKDSVVSALTKIKESAIDKLSDKKHTYIDKLQYYDDVILDIRHYIRDENTRLNACQAANVLYRLQRIERKRAEVKCELKRIGQVIDTFTDAINVAKTFEYAPYKPRVIKDMDEFLKKEINS